MNFNPIQLLQAMKCSNNPMGLLNQVLGSNPQMHQALNIIGGKNPAQLRQVAMNMARERGIDLEQMASQMGLRLPK